MKEKRIGEWGNNITRLLYFLEDIDDNIVDSYEYKAPTESINVKILIFINKFYQLINLNPILNFRLFCLRTIQYTNKCQGQLMNIILLT